MMLTFDVELAAAKISEALRIAQDGEYHWNREEVHDVLLDCWVEFADKEKKNGVNILKAGESPAIQYMFEYFMENDLIDNDGWPRKGRK
jgi:hypothetical protein